jgi:thiosulfate dehydrogenase (quinone) large subunit
VPEHRFNPRTDPGPTALPTATIGKRWAGAGTSLALLPLRLFLGTTFVFAGLQKLANPNFFNHSSSISIWAQLVGAERTSPIGSLLGHLLRVATPLGAFIAVGEVAIGLGVGFGLLTRVAAAGGMLLSFGLFLTVSFHSHPYYTGADIVVFFAFTPLLLGGAGGVLALDAALRRAAQQEAVLKQRRLQPTGPRLPSVLRPGLTGASFQPERRALLAKAATGVGALAVVAIGLDAAIGRLVGQSATTPSATPVLGGGGKATTSVPTTRPPTTVRASAGGRPPTTTGTSAGPTSTTVGAEATPPGKALGPAKEVPVGGAAMFQDPATGDPGIVIQRTTGHFVAFDAVCPHAGCTVGYSAANDLIVCPCHGSEFNPQTGALIMGPAPHGLSPIHIGIGPNDELYAV